VEPAAADSSSWEKLGIQNAWRVKPITEINGNFFRVNPQQKARKTVCAKHCPIPTRPFSPK